MVLRNAQAAALAATSSRPSRRWLTLAYASLVASVLIALGAGCSFDPSALDERRCLNTEACESRFGAGWICVQEYCQQQQCIDNTDCDDGTFCNGPEQCAPDDPNADDEGCIPGVLEVADDLDCTFDYCDELVNRVIHDPASCACAGATDRVCEELNNNPCVIATCDPATLACSTTNRPAQEACDDGADVTREGETICNAQAQCLPQLTQDELDDRCRAIDGFFCNGAETFDPTDPNTDTVTGCVPAAPPTFDGTVPACASTACIEFDRISPDEVPTGEVVLVPSETCECRTDADCARDDCTNFVCDPDTFTCVQDVLNPLLPEGSACEDGFACTADDICDADGACISTPSDLYCSISVAGCDTGVCAPGDAGADATTGCVCNAN